MVRSRVVVSELLAAAAVTLCACAPLPYDPALRGPTQEAGPESSSTMTARELVWVSARGTLRIEATRMCREDGESSDACLHLSTSDRRELDRFFGARNFRERWDAYRPCPHRGDASEAFQVTFADGHTVAKPLDHPFGTPTGPACDRATRDSVAGIGEDLEKRYFR